ncbi:MAG: DUF1015 domain-containing protein [Candidatus Riflebacteria bacterium]|nr:DUF1015 domain-containing protein [Candidatus Riflebacteria bacterium]
MATIRPFKGIRAPKETAPNLAALPYDVINSEEARKLTKGNPQSFLHVTKPEVDLDPGIDLYDSRVYAKAKENFQQFKKNGWLIQDSDPHLYVYKQVMDGREQIGLMCCCTAEEYWKDTIKKHELTRADKEEDRLKHVDVINANAGPVFLTYRAKPAINKLVEEVVRETPEYDFVAPDNIRHVLWVIKDKGKTEKIISEFSAVPVLYVADGHHRSAAASRIAKVRKEKNPDHTGKEEYNFFLAVLFPHNHLYIMDYNRTVKDLNGNSPEEFLKKLEKSFTIEKTNQKKPVQVRTFGMYLKGQWYKLTAKSDSFDPADPVESLDVSILQNNLLSPILGIQDPRKDKRIDFIGGIRGMQELEKVVDSGKFAVSFSMFPTSIEQLMAIADNGKIMPPKSTWFEPKLRSGVVIHSLED